MGRFVRDHPVTVTGNYVSLFKTYASKLCLFCMSASSKWKTMFQISSVVL
jgi:hypothetical protein